MYISHIVVLHLKDKFNFVDYLNVVTLADSVMNYLIRLTVLIVLTTLISTILHKTLEKWSQKLGSEFIKKIKKDKLQEKLFNSQSV